MQQTTRRLLKVKPKTVVTVLVLGFSIFLLSGSLQAVYGFMYGFRTVMDARFGLTSMFFGGFLFTGVLGLMFALQNRNDKTKCLLGFLMLMFSFAAIEVLFNTVT
jgi:uncharacterized membrane protein HdeD (DUF308 family)